MNKHELDSKTDYLSDWASTQRNVILDIWTWATANWMIDFDRFWAGISQILPDISSVQRTNKHWPKINFLLNLANMELSAWCTFEGLIREFFFTRIILENILMTIHKPRDSFIVQNTNL